MKFKVKGLAASIAAVTTVTAIELPSHSEFSQNHQSVACASSEDARSSAVIHASPANIYQDVGTLSDHSDLVVVGRFRGSPTFHPEVMPELPPRTNLHTEYPTEREVEIVAMRRLSYSDMSFQVSEVLKGRELLDGLSSPTVKVGQISVTSNDQLIGVSGDRLFKNGEEYVLFLSASDEPSQFYWPTGTSQGAFFIQAGRVSSLNTLKCITDLGPVVQNQPLEAFLDTVKSNL